ncbi:MAG: hypothetical protein RQ966_16260 [Acetobacteraceae bacterium]|nr:hypothetical protein [Acetobacteraceae bacterium]
MALDTSRIRKRLPPPPADGNPALEESSSAPPRTARSGESSQPGASATPARDGRSLRATGRTVQMNLKVTPEIRQRMLALAERSGLLLAEVLEEALTALERKRGR